MQTIAIDLLALHWQGRRARHPKEPLNRALYEVLRSAVLDASLTASARLPASREVSSALGLSRNTVVHAYDRLIAEGYFQSLTGSGTFVSDVLPDLKLEVHQGEVPTQSQDLAGSPAQLSSRGHRLVQTAQASVSHWGAFVPGVPDVSLFPHLKFNQLLNRYRKDPPPQWRSYTSGGGLLQLREALCEHLRQTRSVQCEPDQVVITEGAHQGMDLVSRLMSDAGDLCWVEEPGYWGLRSLLQINGLRLRGMPVDAEGLNFEPTDWKKPPRLIFVTPSHQYPLGCVMTVRRRFELMEQAERHGSWIVEDDYDSEFRYAGHPIPSLQGLVPRSRVIYAGTFSKTAYPALRLAYLVLPKQLAESFRLAYPQLYRQGQWTTQAALAEFIIQGHFAGHIRRMRMEYARRRQMLHSLIAKRMGQEVIHPYDSTAGLHLVMALPGQVSDQQVLQLAADRGVVVRALSDYYQRRDGPQGLLMGFACVPRESMVSAFEHLMDAIQQARMP